MLDKNFGSPRAWGDYGCGKGKQVVWKHGITRTSGSEVKHNKQPCWVSMIGGLLYVKSTCIFPTLRNTDSDIEVLSAKWSQKCVEIAE